MDDNLGLPVEIADVIGPDWRTVPHKFHGNLRHVRGNFPLVAKVVKTLMSANRNRAVPRKLDAAMRQYRTELHQPAFHDQAPVVTKDEQKIHKYVCNVAGFCVHGSEGVLIRAMHDQLLRALCASRLPTANKVGRAALADSNVVICVVSERTEAAAGPMPVGAAALAPIVTILNKWAYLGFVDLGTRGFQSQLLHRVDAGTVRVGSDKIAATSKRYWTFTNTWDFVRYLDKTGTWYLRVCTFSASSRLLGTLDINECSVDEMPPWPRGAALDTLFWDGESSIAQARKLETARQLKEELEKAPKGLNGSKSHVCSIIWRVLPNTRQMIKWR